jgi:hypothetical protein
MLNQEISDLDSKKVYDERGNCLTGFCCAIAPYLYSSTHAESFLEKHF